jgi:hypothetical protein
MELVERQSIWAGVASFVLVGSLLFAALRSLRLVLCTLVTLAVGLLLTAVFAAYSIGHLNPVSVAFAVLFIGLGVDFGIHLCVHFREHLESTNALDEALRSTARGVGSSLVICAVTTALAFYAFIPTDYRGVAELGLISGTGMFVSLFCSVTVLPALLSQFGGTASGRVPKTLPVPVRSLMTLPLRHARAIRIGAAVLAVGAFFIALEIRFDHNPLTIRDPNTDSVTAFYDLLEDNENSLWSVNVVVPDLKSARTVSERLRHLDSVSRTLSVVDLVPPNQDEKLAILEDIAVFLPPAPESDELAPRPGFAEQIGAVRALRSELAQIAEEEPTTELGVSARRLDRSLGRFLEHVTAASDPPAEIRLLEQSLLASLPERLRMLYASLRAAPISLADLPPEVTEPLMGEGGRLRVEVFPSKDLGDNEALEHFVASVHAVEQRVDPGVEQRNRESPCPGAGRRRHHDRAIAPLAVAAHLRRGAGLGSAATGSGTDRGRLRVAGHSAQLRRRHRDPAHPGNWGRQRDPPGATLSGTPGRGRQHPPNQHRTCGVVQRPDHRRQLRHARLLFPPGHGEPGSAADPRHRFHPAVQLDRAACFAGEP